MDINNTLDYIHSLNRFGIKLGLDNTRKLLDLLGNPQDKLAFIHIAGTNGKGSTASFIAHGLMSAGYKVGRFVSPFLEVFNERIQVNNDFVADDDLIRITARVRKVITSEDNFKPTEFEVVTAIGFCYFLEQAVDVVVLEVGMGGRYDSTNVINAPLLTVITPISLDHMQYLGETIAEIAGEKAGIIKTGSSVIAYQPEGEALAVIEKVCQEKDVSLKAVIPNANTIDYKLNATTFDYQNDSYSIKMLGSYQVQNAILAIESLRILNQQSKFKLNNNQIKEGLDSASWAGRFEKVSDNPLIFIDGAHNLAGIKALKNSMDLYFRSTKKVAIFGIMADKAVDEIVDLIRDDFDEIHLVTANNPRALKATELECIFKNYHSKAKITIYKNIDELSNLKTRYQNQNVVIIGFGSLYLVGDLRKIFMSKERRL